MSKGVVDRLEIKHFSPDSGLTKYMHKRLQLAAEMEKLDAVGDTFTVGMDNRDRNLRTQKTRILNEIIFPAMANLTFFFEVISQHPWLQTVFENDIKDLLGIRRNVPSERVGYMFQNLIRSILAVGGSQYEEIKNGNKSDFRLILNHIAQEMVRDKVSAYFAVGYRKQKDGNIRLDDFANEGIRQNIMADFVPIMRWTGALAASMRRRLEDDDKPHRTFDFKVEELIAPESDEAAP